MYGELSAAEIDAVLNRHRYGRLVFTLDDESYAIPINYGYDGARLYCQAPVGAKGQIPGGTKLAGMRQNSHVAFQVDEIQDPAHWRSVLLQGRFHEVHDRAEKQAGFQRVVAQAGGGERSEVSWGLNLDQLVVFTIDITQRHGRFEQREAYDRRPLPKGPRPPILGSR
jgi:nitroimidazol reductase NimA-like FMN-containing flavoprotein (pyridoxamine 5'-phosphate oxidase superfamily)